MNRPVSNSSEYSQEGLGPHEANEHRNRLPYHRDTAHDRLFRSRIHMPRGLISSYYDIYSSSSLGQGGADEPDVLDLDDSEPLPIPPPGYAKGNSERDNQEGLSTDDEVNANEDREMQSFASTEHIPPPDEQPPLIGQHDGSKENFLSGEASSQAKLNPPEQSVKDSPIHFQAEDILQSELKSLADYLISEIRAIKSEGINGWAEISQALKDVDEEKISSCKEDIDTLLVFAGLFSAVLTAFIIESYQNLSPDPVVQLLTQLTIQTQGYVVIGTSINSTAASIAIPTFTVPPSAVRINTLWFVSLVLSLVTASFAILIKQWLRAYRAVDPQHSNLRARLRIRQFRYPGLIKWKVFELAAILPLLLQISLGLFLLGLCFFTLSIDPTVGRSSTPVVAGWITLFISSALAPAVSSDCPYKITLLVASLQAARTQLCLSWSLKWLYAGPADFRFGRAVTELYAPRWAIVRLYLFMSTILDKLEDRWKVKIRWAKAAVWIHEVETALQRQTLIKLSVEETEVAKDEQKDLAMLITVDDVLSDDDLLGTTMCPVVAQNQPDPEDVLHFIIMALEHRLPQLQGASHVGVPISDFRGLSFRAWQALVKATRNTLQRHLQPYAGNSLPQEVSTAPWFINAIFILLSRRDQSFIPPNEFAALFYGHSKLMLQSIPIAPNALSGLSFQDVWTYLHEIFSFNDEGNIALIFEIHRGQHCVHTCRHTSYIDQAQKHPPSPHDQRAIRDIVFTLIASSSLRRLSHPGLDYALAATVTWPQDTDADGLDYDFMKYVFKYLDTPVKGELQRPRFTVAVEFLRYLQKCRWIVERLHEFDVFARAEILDIFMRMLNAYSSGLLDETPGFSSINILVFCDWSLAVYSHATARVEQNEEGWTLLLAALVAALHKYYEKMGASPGQMGSSNWISWRLGDQRWRSLLEGEERIDPSHLHLWNRIVEALHMFIIRGEYYNLGRVEAQCQRQGANAKFTKETLLAMVLHGWRVDVENAVSLADLADPMISSSYELGEGYSRNGDDSPSSYHIVIGSSPSEYSSRTSSLAPVITIPAPFPALVSPAAHFSPSVPDVVRDPRTETRVNHHHARMIVLATPPSSLSPVIAQSQASSDVSFESGEGGSEIPREAVPYEHNDLILSFLEDLALKQNRLIGQSLDEQGTRNNHAGLNHTSNM